MDALSKKRLNTNFNNIPNTYHNLILYNTYDFKHIMHLNGQHLMTNDNLKQYYSTPSQVNKIVLIYAMLLFVSCHPQPMHQPVSNIQHSKHLENEYIIQKPLHQPESNITQ